MTIHHTPGPWRQTGVNVRAGDALICWATNHHANAETPEPEKLANARLIAAAPDLLAVLQQIVEDTNKYIESGDFDSFKDWMRANCDDAECAIAKAKGRE